MKDSTTKPAIPKKSNVKAKAKAKSKATQPTTTTRKFGCTKCRGKVGCTKSCITGNTRAWTKKDADEYAKKQRLKL